MRKRAECFDVKDCALITMSVNVPPVYDLRDLRERLEVCPAESLYHHFCQTLLRPTFDDPEYHNDLAFWARHHLHDKTLAERFAIVNPFDFGELESLRLAVLDIVEDRIAELPHISNVQTGGEFRFLQALDVTFDTTLSVRNPEQLPEALEAMTASSVWYHYIESRRRNPGGLDDFSLWLRAHEVGEPKLFQALSEVDFYFLSLRRLQEELVSIAATYLSGVTS
jgi:hypothetical protein